MFNAAIRNNFWKKYDWKLQPVLKRKFSKPVEPEKLPDFTINSFHQIGLMDPFPYDDKDDDSDSNSIGSDLEQ